MAATGLFLTSNSIENIVITSLVLAAKFYLEPSEVVVNCDIARLLQINHQQLNQMELTLIQVIDALYVSIHDYNKQASIYR